MPGTDSYQITISSDPQDTRASLLTATSIDMNEPIKAQSLGNGVIRLYREFSDSAADISPCDNRTTLSILAVPTYFTATDLLGFIGEPYMKEISHVRILKSEKANRFLVLLKFTNYVRAAEFKYLYDGKMFNSMEPETCHVVYVSSVRVDYKHEATMLPFIMSDPFTGKEKRDRDGNERPEGKIEEMGEQVDGLLKSMLELGIAKNGEVKGAPEISNDGANKDEGKLIKENNNKIERDKFNLDEPLPVKLVELPTCPVCLERLDGEVTGLLTIPCQHTFHCQCLSKWRDDTCPVCRYSSSLSRSMEVMRRMSSSGNRDTGLFLNGSSSNTTQSTNTNSVFDEADVPSFSASVPSAPSNTCNECSAASDLWICLICGHMGCSRYAPLQHSLNHFVNTGHCFAMELESSRVWDYAGDNYVHRLITNEADGKLVEIPEKIANSETAKADEIGLEYSLLLINQLASQREHYESLLREQRRPSAAPTQKEFSDLQQKVKELSVYTEVTIPSLKDKLSSKDSKLATVSRELEESNALNDALSTKIDFLMEEKGKLTTQIEELKTENANLAEQVKDLMFFLDSQERFKDQPDEVKEGKVVMKKRGRRK